MSHDPNDLLMSGGGAPALKFPAVGHVVKGVVVKQETQQQTDIDSMPLWWDEAKTQPRLIPVYTLRTDERDPANPDDEGERRLFVNKPAMRYAIADAVRAAGCNGIENGGTLAVQRSADGTPSPGKSAPHQFVAQYQPPAAAAANDLLGVSNAAPAEVPAPAPAPAPTSLI